MKQGIEIDVELLKELIEGNDCACEETSDNGGYVYVCPKHKAQEAIWCAEAIAKAKGKP